MQDVNPAAPLPKVVALLPAWRAAVFIQETLDCLAAQTYPNLEILISDDASPDETAEICQAFAAQRENTRVIRQPRNLGWVGNVNALLRAAMGDYFFFAFHDDVVKPTYVEQLVEALETNPRAVLSFTDMKRENVNGAVGIDSYTSLEGVTDAVARARRLLVGDGPWWIPNRGLFRAWAAREAGGMRQHFAGEFAADSLWLCRLALIGEFVRVPGVLVIKRITGQGLSQSWKRSGWQRIGLMTGQMQAVVSPRLSRREQIGLQSYILRLKCGRLVSKVLARPGVRQAAL